jgi:hypothetical protein
VARTFGSYSPSVPIVADWEETLIFEDEDEQPVDLTGYVVEAQLRATLFSSSVLDLTSDGGHWSIPTPTNGTIQLNVAPEVFASLVGSTRRRQSYFWAIVLRRESDDYRIPLAQGKVTFTRSAVKYASAGELAP